MLVVLLGLYALYQWRGGRETPLLGTFERLAAPRLPPGAYGRTGAIVLRSPGGAAITVVAAPDLTGHRPLRGAVVDIAVERGDDTDPLMWLKTTTMGTTGEPIEPGWRSPQPFVCGEGGAGARAYGPIGSGLTQEI